MNEEARVLVAECMFQQQAHAGQDVIRQGEQGDIVYVVESGGYEVYLEQAGGAPVAQYKAGDSFGELALMYSCARAATVKCVTPGLLWGLDRTTYRTIVKQTSDSMQSSLLQMLRSVNVLRVLDVQQLSALANSMQIVTCQPGHSLLNHVPLDALYILQSGTMSVSVGGAPATTIRPGGVFGDDAVAAEPHVAASQLVSATAMPGERCVLARVTREAFVRHVGALQEIKDMSFKEAALANVPELGALSIAERRQLAAVMTRQTFNVGESIIKNGQELTALFIVYKGSVSLQGSGGGSTLGEGAVFAEGALRHERAKATYIAGAKGQTVCLIASRDTIQKTLGPLSAIVEREQAKLARRQQAANITWANLSQGKILGVGTFGVVRLVQEKSSKAPFALKSMRKQKVYDMGQVEHIIAECKLLAECEHPFIVQMMRTFEDDHYLHLLLELTLGGELFSALRNAPAGAFPERRCQFYAAMIVLIFEYLHDKRIIYRDLKPENLLFDTVVYELPTAEPTSIPSRGDDLLPSLPSRGAAVPPSLPSRGDDLPPSLPSRGAALPANGPWYACPLAGIPQDGRLWLCEAHRRAHVDGVRHARVHGPRDHPQQGP
jgi:cGMP-dependent protein kinase